MKYITIESRGKINLSLDVLRKREDGYHDLKMIMQTVELHDDVLIEKVASGIEVRCENRFVPDGDRNIAYKAAAKILTLNKVSFGVKIIITKRIPVAAGMAGGSGNAAAVLTGINRLFDLGLSLQELQRMGLEIGADVPYCLQGGTMLAEGKGEVLSKLPDFNKVDILLVKPKIGVSTAWVFKNLQIENIVTRPDTDGVIQAIHHKDIDKLAVCMGNVLETVTSKTYPVIDEIKKKLVDLGAVGSLMSGSGPTVFGLFRDHKSAVQAKQRLSNDNFDCFVTKTICEEM